MVTRPPCSGVLTVAAVVLSCGTPAQAGPWAREEGAAFLSLSVTGEDTRSSLLSWQLDPEARFSAYGELGIGHGVTAGIELDWGTTSQMATVFGRYTLTDPDAALQAAVLGGLGYRASDGLAGEVLLRIGGSLGGSFGARADPLPGLAALDGGGWATIDGSAFFGEDGSLSIWQAEATLGLHLSDSVRAIFALKIEDWPQAPLAMTARPSVVLALSDRTSLQGGLVAGLRGSDALGVSLSLWQDF